MANTIFYYSDGTTSTSSDTILTQSSRNLSKTLVSVDIGDVVINIGANAFRDCFGLINVIIPNSVANIDSGAFLGCGNLINISIPNSVISIGILAFGNCVNLTSIFIPNSVVNIGAAAFGNCQGLRNIKISENVSTIENITFDFCSNLTSITIPKKVTSIGGSAFRNCANLLGIYFLGNSPSFGSNCFGGTNLNLKLYRKKNFVTGWPSSVQGVSVVLWSDNVIKSGGTGKLVTKNKKASIQVIAKTSGLPPGDVPAYPLEGVYEYIGTYNEKNRYQRRSIDGIPRFYLTFANNRWGIGVDQIPEIPQFLQASSSIGNTLYPWIPGWVKLTIIQL